MKIFNKMLRIYVAPEALDATVAFYEAIPQSKCAMRVRLEEMGIEVAVIDTVIVLAGSVTSLAPLREAQVAFVVDSLDAFLSKLPELGGEILHAPRDAIGGRNFTARHPDGLVVEYYEPQSQVAAD